MTVRMSETVHDTVASEGSISLTIQVDEDEQQYYVWSPDWSAVPPTRSSSLDRAIQAFLSDLDTELSDGGLTRFAS